nr:hypothetical protein [Candidatus Erwinia dacicola]
MVRYSGFLVNRKRGSLLPKVYEALEMTPRKKPEKPGFAVLIKGFLGTDPYKCILCGDRLRFAGAQAGTQAMALLSERLRGMEKKRWLGRVRQGGVNSDPAFRSGNMSVKR